MSANARADRIPVSNPAEPRQIAPSGSNTPRAETWAAATRAIEIGKA